MSSAESTEEVRRIGPAQLGCRIVVLLLGVVLVLNGSLRLSDHYWPFGPMSQYAFSPSPHDVIIITRVEGRLTDGSRSDLPLRVEQSGISRAEIEAQTADIQAEPELLYAVVDGWQRRHPGRRLTEVWLVQDRTELYQGRETGRQTVEMAHWRVSR